MASKPIELEGIWEEILSHADDLAGQRVRVTVLSPEPAAEKRTEISRTPLRPENQRMLELLEKWYCTPLTEEEKTILDEFPAFRREHPIRFRGPEFFE